MKRKLMTVIVLTMLALVLASVLSIMFKRVPANGKIHIRSDGTVDPQTSEILRDGDMYTFTANIHEPIDVQRNNIVIDGNGYILQGNKTDGIYLHKTKNVTIRNTRIMGFIQGIHLLSAASSILVNNTITNCVYGIISSDSPKSTISNNTITNNEWDGIFLTGSNGSMVNNNIVANHSKWGIYLGFSAGCVLRNNVMTANRWNFGVSVEFIHDIDTSNIVDGRPMYYWLNQRDKNVPADAGHVALINSTNITAMDLALSNNGPGLILVNSTNCLVGNSSLTKNGYYGVQLVDSDNNTIRYNTITHNVRYGIVSQHSTHNIINNNIIENNHQGIHLQDSNDNIIYHNSFVNNTLQVSSENSANIWDDGYPSGGNYWSDYDGVDLYDGPHQNVTGNDGIGDTSYVIDTNNADRYPLMSPKSMQAHVISHRNFSSSEQH